MGRRATRGGLALLRLGRRAGRAAAGRAGDIRDTRTSRLRRGIGSHRRAGPGDRGNSGGGPVGLGIKCYLRHHTDYGPGYRDPPEMLGEFPADAGGHSHTALEASIIKDAVRASGRSSPRSPRPFAAPPSAKRNPSSRIANKILVRATHTKVPP